MSRLLRQIIDKINSDGPLTFAEYMQIALYHPTLGYYSSRVPQPGGDYRTSPTLTDAFGRLIAGALGRMWTALGEPGLFTVVEPGGGGADLAAAAIPALSAPLKDQIVWRFVEPFEKVQSLQGERLQDLSIPVEWSSHLEGPPVTGCLLANEVLDNFPVHILEVTEHGPSEVCVGAEGGRLVEKLAESSSAMFTARTTEALGYLAAGDRFEIRPGVNDWCKRAGAVLERGYLLTIDYGDTTPGLWTKRPAGTIVTYKDETLGVDPLDSPGERDITAHVDFTALQQAAEDAGLVPQLLTTQREFLDRLGIAHIAGDLRHAQQEAQTAGDHAGAVQLLAERGRLQALTARGGLGDLLVFLAAKNAPPVVFDQPADR